MQRYVLGIVTDKEQYFTVLLMKNRPKDQEGKLNFPGGKIEENETPAEAVSREIKEEIGLDIPPDEWKFIGGMTRQNDFEVHVFTVATDQWAFAKKMEDQEVVFMGTADMYNTVFPLYPSVLTWWIFLTSDDYKKYPGVTNYMLFP